MNHSPATTTNTSVPAKLPSASTVAVAPQQESYLSLFTTGKFLKDKMFLIIAGTALSSILAYSAYRKIFGAKKPAALSAADSLERAQQFIQKELERLHDPKIIEEDGEDGCLQKKDFFDLLTLIQLKSKLKLQKETRKNQRERVKILQYALEQPPNSEECLQAFEQYVQKTSELMQVECDLYEKEFQKILTLIGISNEVWEASRERYIQGPATEGSEVNQSQTPDGLNIDSIDKRIYEYLPQPVVPASLTRDRAKTLMLETNMRAAQLFKSYMRNYVIEQINPEFEPLITETLTYDLTYVEYGFGEALLRFATHKYELSKDPEVKEYLDEYLSN